MDISKHNGVDDLEKLREMGFISKLQKGGYFYLPKVIQTELGTWKKEKDKVPFVCDANCVLLIRKNAQRDEVLKGLAVLILDLELRWKKESEKEEAKKLFDEETQEGVSVGTSQR